mgnify:CR=1 FL=1
MNLFSKIPDNFFSILSSKNKNIYGLALVTLYDALSMYHSKIRKSDYLDLLKYRGEKEINSLVIEDDFDLGDGIYDPTLSSKANIIVKRLVDTGWIIIDHDIKTGAEYILLPDYSISMLKLIYDFVSDRESKYVSYVHSTYADLQLEDDNQDEFLYRTLVNAVNKTKDLELEVTKLDHSIRVFHKQLQNIFSPNDVLEQHFDVAREDVVDPIYHPLKTNDSIILYNGPISTILKRWITNENVRNKLVDQCLLMNHQVKDRLEAEKDVIKKVNYIQDTYAKLAEQMDEIDKSQSNYTKASTEKVIYLNNTDRTIKGKLETIFLNLAKVINGEDKGEVYPSIVKDINNSITLYQQGYIDSDSLAKPYKRNARIEGEPMAIDDFEHEINEGLMQSLLDIMDSYSDEKIMDFMSNAFKDNDSIDIKDIPVRNVEDFIMVILGTVKADSRYSFYNFNRPEPLERIVKEEIYDMPNYHFERKGE